MGLVQHASSSTNSGTTLTATFGANTTVGNCLIAAFTAATGGTAPTVSSVHIGGVADNFASAKEGTSAAGIRDAIWTDQNCGQASTALAVAVSATSGIALDAFEWAGVKTSAALDKSNTGTATASPWSSGASGTLTQAAEVAFGVVGVLPQSGTPTITGPASPWTNESQISFTAGGLAAAQMAGFQQVSATTSLTYSGTVTGTNPFNVAVIITLELTTATQGPVIGQRGQGRPARSAARTSSAAAPPARPVVTQARARGRTATQKASTTTRSARPAVPVPTRVLVRPPRGLARPGRITVTRSTGAGVAPPPAGGAARPVQADYDRPWLKRQRAKWYRHGPPLDSFYGSEIPAGLAAAYQAGRWLADAGPYGPGADAPAEVTFSADLPDAGAEPDRRVRRRPNLGERIRGSSRPGRPVWSRDTVVPAAGRDFNDERSERFLDVYRLPRPAWRGSGEYPLPVAERRRRRAGDSDSGPAAG